MTIEHRAETLQSLPDEVLEEVKKCDVILKGPMVTPRAGDPWPNLYGDIVTDVAAEHQGGLGTAPYLMSHGRGEYAAPCSLIRAVGMLVAHIGYGDRKQLLDRALDICTVTERKLVVTTDKDGATAEEFTAYLVDTINGLK